MSDIVVLTFSFNWLSHFLIMCFSLTVLITCLLRLSIEGKNKEYLLFLFCSIAIFMITMFIPW